MSIQDSPKPPLNDALAIKLAGYLDGYTNNNQFIRKTDGAILNFNERKALIHVLKLQKISTDRGIAQLSEKTQQVFRTALEAALAKAKANYERSPRQIVQIKQSDLQQVQHEVVAQKPASQQSSPVVSQPSIPVQSQPQSPKAKLTEVPETEKEQSAASGREEEIDAKAAQALRRKEFARKHEEVSKQLEVLFGNNQKTSDAPEESGNVSDVNDESDSSLSSADNLNSDGEIQQNSESQSEESQISLEPSNKAVIVLGSSKTESQAKVEPKIEKPRSCFSKSLLAGCYTASAFVLGAIFKYSPPVLQEARVFIKDGIRTFRSEQMAYLNGPQMMLECSNNRTMRGVPQEPYLNYKIGSIPVFSIPNPSTSLYPALADGIEAAVDRPTLLIAGTVVLRAALFAGKVLCIKAVRKMRGDQKPLAPAPTPVSPPIITTVLSVSDAEESSGDDADAEMSDTGLD